MTAYKALRVALAMLFGTVLMGASHAQTGTAAPAGNPIAIRPLNVRNMDVGLRVFRSEQEWRTALKNSRPQNPDVPLPSVNWDREMVLVASFGPRPTGGYTAKITDVREVNGRIIARVRETAPGPGAVVTQAVTYPADAVAIPKSDLPVEFAVTTGGQSDSAYTTAVGLAKTVFIMREHGGLAGLSREYVAHLYGNPVPYKAPSFVKTSTDVPMAARLIRGLEQTVRDSGFMALDSQYGDRADYPDALGRTIIVIHKGATPAKSWTKAVTVYSQNPPQAFETMWKALSETIQSVRKGS